MSDWREIPNTLTLFGPSTSDVQPSSNFLSRLWRKNKQSDDQSNQSASQSQPSSREVSSERDSSPDSNVNSSTQPVNLDVDINVDTSSSSSDKSIGFGGETEKDDGSKIPLDQGPQRTLSSVLSRLSNLLEKRSSTLQVFKDSDSKQYWMPDSSCRECYDCGDKFTTFRRRHHCRICGQIFCSKCCNQELPAKIIGYKGGIRVCMYCCKVVLKYAQQSSRDMQDDTEDLGMLSIESDSGSVQNTGIWNQISQRRATQDFQSSDRLLSVSERVNMGQTKPDPFDLTPRSGRKDSSANSEMERKMLLQDSLQLRELWKQILHPHKGVEMQSHRVKLITHHKCIVGNKLVEWLIRNDHATKRVQAIVIGQAFMDVGFLEPVGARTSHFQDNFTLYQPSENSLAETLDSHVNQQEFERPKPTEPKWFLDIESNDEDDLSLSEEQASGSFHSESGKSISVISQSLYSSDQSKSRFNPSTTTAFQVDHDCTEAAPFPQQDSITTGFSAALNNADLGRAGEVPCTDIITSPLGWRNWEQMSEENDERLAYTRLRVANKEHLHSLIQQLLTNAGLSHSWENIIIGTMDVVGRFVRPDVKDEGDDMDIRAYVQVKKIPGGNKDQTSLIHGVMFTKNVAHKKMRQQIRNPKILLLKGSIEYQRVENKFSSLEPQILQEGEFLKHSVAKIAALHPDIILVEKTVSRLAQNFLLEEGITLVYNLKLSVMERLSRFTQADIVPSIDGLVKRPNLGFCHGFKTCNFLLTSGETKTMLCFDGCATHLGCTITLRGGTLSELKNVKKILSFAVFTAYNSQLETSFYMDEFAMPPPSSTELQLQLNIDGESVFPSEPTDLHPQEKGKGEQSQSQKAGTERDSGTSGHQNQTESKVDEPDPSIVNMLEQYSQLQAEDDESDVEVDDDDNGIELIAPAVEQESVDRDVVAFEVCMESKKEVQDEVNLPVNKPGPDEETGSDTSMGITITPQPIQGGVGEIIELTDHSDPLHNYQKNQDDSIFHSSVTLQEQTQTKQIRFKRALDSVILSCSPFVKFDVPFLATELGSKCDLRKYFPDEVYWSELFNEKPTSAKSKNRYLEECSTKPSYKSNIKITEAHPLVLCHLTTPLMHKQTQALLADYRARGGRIKIVANGIENGHTEKNDGSQFPMLDDANHPDTGVCWERKHDCLDPLKHQRLAVLFSSHSHLSVNHPSPCVYPWVVTMDFYARNDITLGGFLERFCFRESYACPSPVCDTPMIHHVRKFLHGSGCISVSLKKLENKILGGQSGILTWSWCKKCKQVTPIVPMSMDTWNMSFAKYLELRFHGDIFTRRASAEPCGHSIHHDHIQFFGCTDIVANLKFSQITLKEIAMPCLVIKTVERSQVISLSKLREETKYLAKRGLEIFSIALDLVVRLKAEVQNDTFFQTIPDYVTSVQEEKTVLKDKIQENLSKIEQIVSDEMICVEPERSAKIDEVMDSIVDTKSLLSQTVLSWNVRIQELCVQQKKFRQLTVQRREYDNLAEGSYQASESVSMLSPPKNLSLPVLTRIAGPEDGFESSEEAVNVSVDYSRETKYSCGSSESSQLSKDIDAISTEKSESQTSLNNEQSKFSSSSTLMKKQPSSDDLLDGIFDKKTFSKVPIIGSFLSGQMPFLIQNPFDATEHHLLPKQCRVPLVVYDHEPSSIIAYSLSSHDYSVKLQDCRTIINCSLNEPQKITDSDPLRSEQLKDESATKRSSGGVLSFLRGTNVESSTKVSSKPPIVDSVKYNPKGSINSEDQEFKQGRTGIKILTTNLNDADKNKNKTTLNQHIELQFSDSTTKFYCKIYFAEQFRQLRKIIFQSGEDAFIRSMSRCRPWEAKGGKSGSAFCKTNDDRFVLKQMSTVEVESFEKFGPQYFQYISRAYVDQQPTVLAKIVGVFRIGFRNNQTNNAVKQDLIVVENLFYNRKVAQTFDLKGSMRNRLVNTSGRQEQELVLLDENLLKVSVDSPLYIRSHSKTVLALAIDRDSRFLASNLVMDYSLLVGLDEGKKQLVVGIIDYVRTFTWDKKVETFVKKASSGKLPTVVSPELYRDRFLKAMDRYFLPVPDQWSGLGRGVDC
ncbi:hypothetical protein ScPMuIL_003671 [Solemya velum]